MANIKQLLSPFQYKKETVIPRKGQTKIGHIWPRTITKVKRNTGTCFFSIWFISLLSYHNRYLLRYENLLRQVDCRVTLAYWDWSLFSMSPWNNTSDRIWYPGPSGLGGNGSDESTGGCVTDGPFSRNVWRKTNGRCLRRRFSGEKHIIPTFSILLFFLFISSYKSCQQILSFPCSNLAHSRKTHESSEILFEHAQHVARI